jgi:hypothetical protein
MGCSAVVFHVSILISLLFCVVFYLVMAVDKVELSLFLLQMNTLQVTSSENNVKTVHKAMVSHVNHYF